MATSPFILGHGQRLARLAGLSESLSVWSDESAGGHEETGGLLGEGGVCWCVQMVIWVGGGKMWYNVIWVWSSDGSCVMEGFLPTKTDSTVAFQGGCLRAPQTNSKFCPLNIGRLPRKGNFYLQTLFQVMFVLGKATTWRIIPVDGSVANNHSGRKSPK